MNVTKSTWPDGPVVNLINNSIMSSVYHRYKSSCSPRFNVTEFPCLVI